MPSRRNIGPKNSELARLEVLIENAETGTPEIDAEIANAFFPNRSLLTKAGELFWCSRTADGSTFDPVPRFTRSLDAKLPDERVTQIGKLGGQPPRWRAFCDGLAEADAATEPLARRLLAIRLLKVRWRPSPKYPTKAPVEIISPSNDAPKVSTEIVDDRDIMIAAMVNELKRLRSGRRISRESEGITISTLRKEQMFVPSKQWVPKGQFPSIRN